MIRQVLLVVDLQTDFKDEHGEYERCLRYITRHQGEYDTIIGTVFSQIPYRNGNFQLHRGWNGCINVGLSHVEYALRVGAHMITKETYGLPYRMMDGLCEKDDFIDIIGCGAESSVMATAFMLWDNNYEKIKLLTDYIYTLTPTIQREEWIRTMRENFGDCVE